MFWPTSKRKLTPDLEAFNKALARSVNLNYGPEAVAGDFRRLFLNEPELGKRVLFMLLTWCGEFEVDNPDDPESRVPPVDPMLLQRWAGKREVAAKIKAAIYADLNNPS